MTEWISVKERLPEKNKKVLVHDPDYVYGIDCIYIDYMGIFDYARNKLEWSEDRPVSHWMPLPEPPNE